jgi:cytidylate kinase
MNEKYFITIGRQFGSKGHAIGKLLAKKLGIAFYDKELISIASKKSGLGKEFFEKADEKSTHSLLGGLLGLRNSMFNETYLNNYLCNETLFKIQSEVIRDISKKQSAVFIGRCSDYILKDKLNCINIFIYADLDDRIKNIANNYQLSDKDSRSLIQETDKSRMAYYDYYTSKEWGKAASYHFCINSSLLGLENTINIIHQVIVQKFFQD